MLGFLGPLIGAGASLIGGFLGRDAQKDAAEQNAQIARENAASQERINAQQMAMAERNIALQQQFAQEGVRWKVADARAAGVHPLYALGASTSSFSPVSVGLGASSKPYVNADMSMPNAMHSMGQDISRGVSALMSPKDKMGGIAMVQTGLQTENMKLQNDLLRARISVMTQPGTPPGVFTVPEGKIDPNPPLMIEGNRVPDEPGWSPTKAISDRWGDESFATNMYGNIRAVRDLAHTVGWNPESWRLGAANAVMGPYSGYKRATDFSGFHDAVRGSMPVRPSYTPRRY